MPITQARMIMLIQAARAFEQALEAAKHEIDQRARIAARGASNPATELAELAAVIRPEFMVPGYAEHRANLAVEERHFALHQRSNDRRAQNEEAKRRRRGIAPSDTAPPTLVPSLRRNLLTARTLQPESTYDEASEVRAKIAAAEAEYDRMMAERERGLPASEYGNDDLNDESTSKFDPELLLAEEPGQPPSRQPIPQPPSRQFTPEQRRDYGIMADGEESEVNEPTPSPHSPDE